MTVEQFIDIVWDYVIIKSDKIMFSCRCNGGWERWLQLELARFFSKQEKILNVVTEWNNPLNSERVDIEITDKLTGREEMNFIEIKCARDSDYLKENMQSFAAEIFTDWNKQISFTVLGRRFCLILVQNDINGYGKTLVDNIRREYSSRYKNELNEYIILSNGFDDDIKEYMYICIYEVKNAIV